MTNLVDNATYQRVTGDTVTAAPAVTAALAEAEAYANEHCNRVLAYGTHTEILDVTPDGKVYPAAPPIESVQTPNVTGVAIQGFGIFLGYFNPGPILAGNGWADAIPPQVTVTYKGGYQPIGTASPSTPVLPAKLARAISRIAYLSAHPATSLAGLPAGANKVSVGDVSVGGNLSPMELLDASTLRDLNRFRRIQPRGWQT